MQFASPLPENPELQVTATDAPKLPRIEPATLLSEFGTAAPVQVMAVQPVTLPPLV